LGKLVDGHDGEDGVAADEGVAMLEVGEDGGDERLNDLRLIEAAEETEGDAADVLVGVLEVVAEILADEDHLGEDFASGIGLVNDLEVEEEKLLDGVVLGGEDVADDGDEELWNGFAVEEEHDGLLQFLDLRRDVVSLESFLDLVAQRRRALVEVDNQSARLIHCSDLQFSETRSEFFDSKSHGNFTISHDERDEEDEARAYLWDLSE